ncbi:MAG: hypothetical protein K2P22_04815 [Lachnospiraceae bacterium]|nr:hypothetical protein [Lachnospiraceae bacterium]
MGKTDEAFRSALSEKKIPILTLDNKWHQLFTQQECTDEIRDMECELNGLLKRQGKVNEKKREIRKLKKKLMDEIVLLADEMEGGATLRLEKEMETHKRLVAECNDKLKECDEEMLELPGQIVQLNNRLMLETMEICYRKLHKNTEELEEIEEWISNIRRELKKKVVRKQEKEMMNHQLYSYMHDIFGADVIEIFDMKYDPVEGRGKKKGTVREPEDAEAEKKKEASES